MNETNVTNADIAAAFHSALKHLWDGKTQDKEAKNQSRYICFALNRADARSPCWQASYAAAALIVQKRIAPSASVEEWLMKRVPGFVDHCENFEAIQDHRITWVNMLINEFNALPPHKFAIIR